MFSQKLLLLAKQTTEQMIDGFMDLSKQELKDLTFACNTKDREKVAEILSKVLMHN